MENETRNLELKHLAFFRIAAIQTVVVVTNLYVYAKQNSGPLKSPVQTVEDAVTTVVSPAYEKLKTLPDDLLVFLDKKVDKATNEFDKRAPTLAKQAVNLCHNFIQHASKTTQEIFKEFQTGGARAAVHYTAKEYKQLAINQAVKLWTGLNRLDSFHKLADLAVPSVARWSEKYNYIIQDMRQKGYFVFGYFPEIPVSQIAKTFRQSEAKKKVEAPESAAENGSDSD